MKVQLSHILENMFSARSLEELPAEKIQQVIGEHPYFGTAHFLLTQKLKNDPGSFSRQAQKTALYFHDPLWLQWLLTEPEPAEEAVKITAPVAVEEPAPIAEAPVTEEPVTEEPAPAPLPVPQVNHQPEPVQELAFDPYYTIDYFASQGIKAPAEIKADDKLGKQLKSFTEWLKTMKRLPQAGIELRTDEAEQQDIQQIAAGSLEQKEVVTETMAEVLAKQDKNGEAIAIYEKLSLLDPSKRAYFAAKIEHLKAK
ncbi:MAG TPA: hypothetical protein VD996_16675 [Chitinophagaceae bacterium]|nr:hypothetical protein [Chitinophagaceae bacterium]